MRLINGVKPLLLAACLSLASAAMGQSAGGDAQESATLNRIRDRGYMYLAYRPAAIPFSYEIAGNQGATAVTGYTWELCGHVVKAVEAALGKEIKVVAVPDSINNRLMLVKSGMADIECGATGNLTSRQKLATFSNTYYVAEVKVAVRADAGFKSVNDLANKRVLSVSGTPAARMIRQAAFARGINVEVIEVRQAAEAMAMLEAGKADAFVGEDATLNHLRIASGNPEAVQVMADSLSIEPYGLVLPLEDEGFRRLVNKTLGDLMASGELERLYEAWFVGPIPPKGGSLNMPMSPMMKSVIQYPNDRPATY